MKILILGGQGQTGIELTRLTWPDGVEAVAPPRTELDICDENAVATALASEPWSAVVNAAAYTNVDGAETDVVRGMAGERHRAGDPGARHQTQ